jgi:hypothetical protein
MKGSCEVSATRSRSRGRHLLRLRYWLAAFCVAAAVTAPAAGASAHVNNVYAPEDHGYFIRGWANVTRDCSGTYGC